MVDQKLVKLTKRSDVLLDANRMRADRGNGRVETIIRDEVNVR